MLGIRCQFLQGKCGNSYPADIPAVVGPQWDSDPGMGPGVHPWFDRLGGQPHIPPFDGRLLYCHVNADHPQDNGGTEQRSHPCPMHGHTKKGCRVHCCKLGLLAFFGFLGILQVIIESGYFCFEFSAPRCSITFR